MSDVQANQVNWNITNPTDWAYAQLNYMGLPVTAANIAFMVSWAAREGGAWENTAHYNPLNTTEPEPGYTETGSQGNIGSYVSWQQGVQATAQTLQGYGLIMQALRSGNPWAANDNGSLAGELQTWSGSGYTQVSPNGGYGSTQGSGSQGAAGAAPAGTPGTGPTPGATQGVPGLNDIPALKQYIEQNDPTYAWLLTVPQVATAFMDGIAAGDSIQQIVAALQQTAWWKSTTTAYRTFLSNYYSSPNDYNFNSQGSTAQGMQSQVEATAATNGVTLNTVQAQTIAIDALKYGWNSQQIQAAIGSQVYVQGAQGAQTDAGSVVQALQSQAGQYLMDPNDPVLNSWAQNIAGGTQTMAQFDAYLKQWASTKWSGMAGQIRNGNTPQQIVAPLQSSIANTLEISPAQVDFINNPQFGKILDYVPPNSTTGVHQIMTNSQAQQYVKQDAALGYGNTQGARDNAAQLEQAIVQNFGKVGS